MRIDWIEIQNFKKYEKQEFGFKTRFTLLVGDNGVGKTTVLDALAVAAGIWLVDTPDSTLFGSRRNILPSQIRLKPEFKGDRLQFIEQRPVIVRAKGQIGDCKEISWTRQIRPDGKRTTNADAEKALEIISDIYERDNAGEHILCPVLAYYGAGRAWLASNERLPSPKEKGPARRWAAFYDCFSERIRFGELQKWFKIEAIERGNREGRWRPGFEVVRRAIMRCVPGADDISFNGDREQIVISIAGNAQPFDNLSAGQRMMVAMVADLAIKAVTQNAYLLPSDSLGPEDEPLPRVLDQTPGMVLIDELDVHLHPTWQRRIATDLKTIFPKIQFVCTSHSPQVIGELQPEEIIILDKDGYAKTGQSFGMDSSRILEEVMHASPRNTETDDKLKHLFRLIDDENFAEARQLIPEIAAILHNIDDPELTKARSLMAFLEST